MRLLLKINNNWVEPEFSQDDNKLSLDWSYGSLDSPADYIGEYALDFTIPRSQHNNKLFDSFYRVDKTTDPETFDPAIKLPYNIISNRGQVISTGTAYIQSIDKNNYKIYLSGALHTIFSKALNSGWDTAKAEEDEDYYLLPEYIKLDRNGTYTNEPKINASMVYWNWRYGEHPSQNWTDFASAASAYSQASISKITASEIISWIPTHQGVPEGMEQDKWLYKKSDGSVVLYPILCKTEYEPGTPFQIADELREYQMAEFRSYNQQPAVYVRRLWDWYRMHFKQMTDYDLELDPGWYNADNPYLKNVWYTLPKLKRNYVLDRGMMLYDETLQSNAGAFPATFNHSAVNNVTSTATFTFPEGFTGGDIKVNWAPYINNESGRSGWYYWNYFECALIVTIRIKNSSNTIKYQRKHGMYVIPWSNDVVLNPSNGLKTNIESMTDEQHYMRYTREFNDNTHHNLQWVFADEVGRGYDFLFTCMIEDGDYLEVETKVYDNNVNHSPFITGWYTSSSNWWEELWGNEYTKGEPSGYYYASNMSLQASVNVYGSAQAFEIRSNSPISLERLFESENPFSILLKYSKYTNLIWMVDDYNKRVVVYDRAQHFYECMNANGTLPSSGDSQIPMIGIINITDRVDTTSDVVLTPIDWGSRYLYMNFGEANCDFLDEYREKYSRTYGSKMLVTPNKRVDFTKNMFCNGDNDTAIEASDVAPYYIPIGTAYDYNVQAHQCETLLLNSTDGNTGMADIHGQFVFRNPNGRWTDRLVENFRENLNSVIISDDTTYEVNEQKYYYHGTLCGTDTGTRYKPIFSPVNTVDNVAFWFAFPRDAYAPLNYAQDTGLLYDKWKEYLMEMYYINNKTIQCKINITDTLYRRLKINPLVQIDNCVYIMVKMEGYNENSDWVKCTLKQFGSLQNITAGALTDGGGTSNDNLWMWDDENFVAFDDELNLRIGDGTGRVIDPLRPYEPIWSRDPVPELPERASEIVRTQGNNTVYIPVGDAMTEIE